MDNFEVYIQIRQLLEQGFTKTSISKKLGISRPTLYRYLEKSPKEMAEWIDSTKTFVYGNGSTRWDVIFPVDTSAILTELVDFNV